MEERRQPPVSKELLVFFAIVALSGLSMGLSDSTISNYFKDAYNVTAAQRGFLELPREAPGILCFIIIAIAAAVGDVRLAIIAQLFTSVGAMVLGFFTPSFAVMSLFVFIHSMGAHLYMPLQDSIGMSIIGKEGIGKRVGQYSGIRTAFTMFASILIFFGFRMGFFSFKTPIKLPFILGATGFLGVFALYLLLHVKYKVHGVVRERQFKIIIRKEYTIYYILAVLTGVHRQIMIVFGPWILIETLNQQADILALLGIIGSFIGIFLIPAVGRWIDRFGSRMILFTEGVVFIVVYFVYGYMSDSFTNGTLAKVGLPLFIVCGLFVFDRLAMQMGLARTVYLRTIAKDPTDITPTLSLGLSMDHVVSITCAYLGGIGWYQFGPQYVFYGASILSILNVIVALMIKPMPKASAVQAT